MTELLRTLMPAVGRQYLDQKGDEPDEPNEREDGSTSDRKRRRVASAACETCRRRRTKCDERRPQCSPCTSRNLECHYVTQVNESRMHALRREHEELKQKSDDAVEVCNLLVSASDEDALQHLHRIRSTPNISTALSAIRSDLQAQTTSVQQNPRSLIAAHNSTSHAFPAAPTTDTTINPYIFDGSLNSFAPGLDEQNYVEDLSLFSMLDSQYSNDPDHNNMSLTYNHSNTPNDEPFDM